MPLNAFQFDRAVRFGSGTAVNDTTADDKRDEPVSLGWRPQYVRVTAPTASDDAVPTFTVWQKGFGVYTVDKAGTATAPAGDSADNGKAALITINDDGFVIQGEILVANKPFSWEARRSLDQTYGVLNDAGHGTVGRQSRKPGDAKSNDVYGPSTGAERAHGDPARPNLEAPGWDGKGSGTALNWDGSKRE